MQPTLYLPHGGGPCFFMDWHMGPPDTWDRMASWLGALPGTLPSTPTALLVISAHWEEPTLAVTTASAPPLLYDYFGFPPHTYELTWPAPGSPELAGRVSGLLRDAGFDTRDEPERGFDHGVFIPLKVAYPKAELPTVQLSLKAGLDPAEHLTLGRALAPLREEGVLIIGSGMSYHNMQNFNRPAALPQSQDFDRWLAETIALEQAAREARLVDWSAGPSALESHPREEHLLPLMVAAGAAGAAPGEQIFQDTVMGAVVSGFRFG